MGGTVNKSAQTQRPNLLLLTQALKPTPLLLAQALKPNLLLLAPNPSLPGQIR